MTLIKNTDIEVNPMSLKDYIEFHGDKEIVTVKGYSFRRDGELLSVAGVRLVRGMYIVFSEIKENAIVSDMTIWRCTKYVIDRLDRFKFPLYANPDDRICNAPLFLKKLGFKPFEDSYRRLPL